MFAAVDLMVMCTGIHIRPLSVLVLLQESLRDKTTSFLDYSKCSGVAIAKLGIICPFDLSCEKLSYRPSLF